ncbi:hypothetical protein [Chryseobacterium sp.]|uniref:hypothetical protein n=1 Tax=Chryseobacterium sp. TaxID=1871047 RepID=UPI0024E1D8F6|nr:hypothetical protein [Chryseobacterium sp.]
MRSSDRILFGTIIKQNTKDGQMLSVSDLQNAYNSARFQYGWSERRISDIMKYHDFQERCYHLLNERGIIKTTIIVFMQMIEKEGVVKVLKGLGVWKTGGRGENKSTYSDPYIWVLLAMELNPLIYAKVVIWLTDSLIMNRIIAGSEFKPMNSAINRIISNPNYPMYTRLINLKVFGKHEKGLRDTASEDQLHYLFEMERFIIQSIDMGIINNEVQLIKVIDLYKIRKSVA